MSKIKAYINYSNTASYVKDKVMYIEIPKSEDMFQLTVTLNQHIRKIILTEPGNSSEN